ncbi:MAG: NAD(P)/FAD-dependent oxidoreductase [Desulfovibrionaceae bacterium]
MHPIYDVVILGAGPGGLQAAIHATRKKASTLVLGRLEKSSLFWAHVENFCCQLSITGEEMLRQGRAQAQATGAVFVDEDALEIRPEGRHFEIVTEAGTVITARSLVLAMGTARNRLGVPGEKELLGRGVSYCVDCDGMFYRNEPVAVVGGRSAAAGGALTLTEIASEVTLVAEELDVAPALRERLEASGVRLVEGMGVESIDAGENGAVEGLRLKDGSNLKVAGVFIELGAKGVLELAGSLGLRLDDSMKYVHVDRGQRTNVPGVYAAGDITGPPLQIAKAVGEGCVAGIEAATYARKLKSAQTGPREDDEE